VSQARLRARGTMLTSTPSHTPRARLVDFLIAGPQGE